ncbi:YfhE family protein [Lentibacillus juripiscarius]|uniref:YfhE family protein n=1 Tax=Lentibacillus juripiscarius TaxID=257446 RepID=A0ABW5V4M8_9BACI
MGKKSIEQERYLSKTQEVLYQKEFRRADREYSRNSKQGNRM